LPVLMGAERQCEAGLAALQPENLRAYVVSLARHFQGYCRDLYTESAMVVVSKVRGSLVDVIQAQFLSGRRLDQGNPTLDTLDVDFSRFGFDLRQALRDQFDGDDTWHQRWNLMNRWRNAIAHAAREPAETLTLTTVREWRRVVERVVAALDAILYRELKRLLRRTPWQP